MLDNDSIKTIYQHHEKPPPNKKILSIMEALNPNYSIYLPEKEECINLIKKYKTIIENLKWFLHSSYTNNDIRSINHDVHTRANGHDLPYLTFPKQTTKSGPLQQRGYIYFLQDSSQRIKIGKTKNLDKRVFNLSVSLPEKSALFHFFETGDITKSEKELHNKYKKYRLNGEWFDLPQEELVKIKEIYI